MLGHTQHASVMRAPSLPPCCARLAVQSTAGVDAAKAGRLPAALTRRFDVYFVPEERIPLDDGACGHQLGGCLPCTTWCASSARALPCCPAGV